MTNSKTGSDYSARAEQAQQHESRQQHPADDSFIKHHNTIHRRNLTPKTHLWYPVDRDLLLLEVSPVLLVDEDEVEVVAGRELLVHVPEGRREVEAAEEEAYGDGFAWEGRLDGC